MNKTHLKNIYYLGIKELIALSRDPILIGFIIYAFTLSIYLAAVAMPQTLHNANISIVDEDQSELSRRIISAFYPPYFRTPRLTDLPELDKRMNNSSDQFSLIIPRQFERDVLAGKKPTLQLNIDATNITQALSGNEHIQKLIQDEVAAFLQKKGSQKMGPVIEIPFRILYNPELKQSWFDGVMEFINNVTLLSLILTGAALIREREHGTVEHMLVMPVTPLEIMVSKIWSMQLVVLVTSLLALFAVLLILIAMPIEGSFTLFMIGLILDLFATACLGIFLATLARSMPQFALIMMLTLLPLLILSGSLTPRESMPPFIQNIMLATPTTNFVILSQAILFRGAGIKAVWPQFLNLFLIGAVLFTLSLIRFRKKIYAFSHS